MTGLKPLKTYKGSGATAGKGNLHHFTVCNPQQGEPHKYYSTVRVCLASGLWKKGQESVMDKLLRAFAGEQLQIIEVTETRSPQRKKLIEEGYKLYNELEEKLNSGEKELLNV